MTSAPDKSLDRLTFAMRVAAERITELDRKCQAYEAVIESLESKCRLYRVTARRDVKLLVVFAIALAMCGVLLLLQSHLYVPRN